MVLTHIMLALFIGGILAWLISRYNPTLAKWFSLLVVFVSMAILIQFASANHQIFEHYVRLMDVVWIEQFAIHYATGIDSLSFILIALTLVLAVICILVSWQEIQQHQGFYYFNLMASLAGIVGVFAATDLFLFFFFWEVMLLPMTALIAIWGHENRHYAAIKFFIFTQVSSLLMLIAIIALALMHQQIHGVLSFDYLVLKNLVLNPEMEFYLMLGFFIAFAVKLPSFPFHTWLPDAHTQAPTAGSVLLAGVLLKTGAYGLIRFVIGLFPEASQEFASIASWLAVISILYGAKLAFAQTDFKRLVAYSSISHMGFITLALFSFDPIAYNGALLTMIAHGFSSAALFSMAGMLYARLHTRDLSIMGGMFRSAPRMGGMLLVFVAAAFGLPGLVNFVGEFLSLTGSFRVFPLQVIFASLGLIGSAIYGMYLFQQSFQGEQKAIITDLSKRELLICVSLLGVLVYLGFSPGTVLMHFEEYHHVVANLFEVNAL